MLRARHKTEEAREDRFDRPGRIPRFGVVMTERRANVHPSLEAFRGRLEADSGGRERECSREPDVAVVLARVVGGVGRARNDEGPLEDVFGRGVGLDERDGRLLDRCIVALEADNARLGGHGGSGAGGEGSEARRAIGPVNESK